MRKRIGALLAVSLTTLAFGATTALAHGGPGCGGAGGVSTSKLVTGAAAQLKVTRASLVAAIQSSANATIDAAVDDGDITTAQAADAKDEVADNLNVAYRLSRASTVASKLGITTAALNSGFNAARKALLNAKIDAALAAGTITADEAASLKAKVAALTTGYKAGGIGGLGGGDFGGGHHH